MSDEQHESPSFRVTDRRGQPKEEQVATPVMAAQPTPPPKPAKEPPAYKEPQGKKAPGAVEFSSFVLSISTQAIVHMGYAEDPTTGLVEKNLPLARQEVAIIEMLDQKTKGNRTPEEEHLMEEVLYELRLRFVEASRTP